jgi:DtxR family transcriptional regulator, Mn-dependent transcriptional regulator
MSESEEMYLVSIARLKEDGVEGPVPLSHLAGELDVLSVSANQMIRKLEENGLVVYTPYKGVELTERGWAKALQVLRYRRLWEVFLVDQLKMRPGEANEMACKLEHDLPAIAAERLAEFLGNPRTTREGKPIPACPADCQVELDLPLRLLGVCQTGAISRIAGDAQTASFLNAERLSVGTELQVLAGGSQGNVLIQINNGAKRVHLSAAVADTIWVYPKDQV